MELNIWNAPSEMISMPQFFWSCGKQFLDPTAPTFQLKTSNLLEVNDSLGIVDYITKSCTGKPRSLPQSQTQESSHTQRSPSWNHPTEVHRARSDTQESLNARRSSSSERSAGCGWVDIPVRELLAKNPRCGWKRNRTQLCKRYIESFCARDCECPFIHAEPLTASRDQIVFLGGLPKNCNRAALFKELIDCGYSIKNYPLVLDRFTPRVVLNTVEAAQKMIAKKKVTLFGKEVDVRAYKSSNEVFQVFLGGLCPRTNLKHIREALMMEGCELANVPSINKGFVINCEVATKSQQEHLIKKGHIDILGRHVQVKRLVKRKRDSKGEWRCLFNLFKRQGASICDERVQLKLREAEDIGTCVKDHLLNVFDCMTDIHDNCLGDCQPRKVSAATKRELQAAKKRMRDKLDLKLCAKLALGRWTKWIESFNSFRQTYLPKLKAFPNKSVREWLRR